MSLKKVKKKHKTYRNIIQEENGKTHLYEDSTSEL